MRIWLAILLVLVFQLTTIDAAQSAGPPSKPKPATAAPQPQAKPPKPAPAPTPNGQYFDTPPPPAAQAYGKLPVAPAQRGEGQVLNRANATRQLPKTEGQYFDTPPPPAAQAYGTLPVAPAQRGEGQVLNRANAARQLPAPNRSGSTSGQDDTPEQPLGQDNPRYRQLPEETKPQDSQDKETGNQ